MVAHVARAITECKDWFEDCGNFVCCDMPANSTRHLACVDVHLQTYKKCQCIECERANRNICGGRVHLPKQSERWTCETMCLLVVAEHANYVLDPMFYVLVRQATARHLLLRQTCLGA
jgi:hypothetical protein